MSIEIISNEKGRTLKTIRLVWDRFIVFFDMLVQFCHFDGAGGEIPYKLNIFLIRASFQMTVQLCCVSLLITHY